MKSKREVKAGFAYRRGRLHGDAVPLSRVVALAGTPTYVYSRRVLQRNARSFVQAVQGLNALVCFAVKANQNLSVLAAFAAEGLGFDIVSGGELYRVLQAGAVPQRVIYSGVGKTRPEMEMALRAGIQQFNVESWEELLALRSAARSMAVTAPVALRVNPDVEADSHPYISTGAHHHKFGIDIQEIPELVEQLRHWKEIRIQGIACHVGSQITRLKPFAAAFRRMSDLYRQLLQQGLPLRTVDVGGGLGVRYRAEAVPAMDEYASLLRRHLADLPARLLLEPGRRLVADAGILLTRVLYRKETRGKLFYIVDAGMNDLVRPTLYQAWHSMLPLVEKSPSRCQRADVVGPICESGDYLARDRLLPPLQSGEVLAVLQAAAYGFAQASNYNARCRAAEVMIDGRRLDIVRARERYEDLVRGEKF